MHFLIVLGCKDRDILRARCETAADYYKNRGRPYIDPDTCEARETMRIIVSGGPMTQSHPSDHATEASLMREILVDLKVPESSITMEDRSVDTVDNFLKTRELLQRLFTPTFAGYIDSIIVCTSQFHIKRAVVIARAVFHGIRISALHTNEGSPDTVLARREIELLDRFLDHHIKFIHV